MMENGDVSEGIYGSEGIYTIRKSPGFPYGDCLDYQKNIVLLETKSTIDSKISSHNFDQESPKLTANRKASGTVFTQYQSRALGKVASGYVSERVQAFSDQIQYPPASKVSHNSNKGFINNSYSISTNLSGSNYDSQNNLPNGNPLTHSLDLMTSASSSSSASSTLQKSGKTILRSHTMEFPSSFSSRAAYSVTSSKFSRGEAHRASYNEKKSSKMSMFTGSSNNKSSKLKSDILLNSCSSKRQQQWQHQQQVFQQSNLSVLPQSVPDSDVGVWKSVAGTTTGDVSSHPTSVLTAKTISDNVINSSLYGKKYQLHHQSSSSLDLDIEHVATDSSYLVSSNYNFSLRKSDRGGSKKLKNVTPLLHREFGSQSSIDIIGKYSSTDEDVAINTSNNYYTDYSNSDKNFSKDKSSIETTSPKPQPKRITSKLWGDKDRPSIFKMLRSGSKSDGGGSKSDSINIGISGENLLPTNEQLPTNKLTKSLRVKGSQQTKFCYDESASAMDATCNKGSSSRGTSLLCTSSAAHGADSSFTGTYCKVEKEERIVFGTDLGSLELVADSRLSSLNSCSSHKPMHSDKSSELVNNRRNSPASQLNSLENKLVGLPHDDGISNVRANTGVNKVYLQLDNYGKRITMINNNNNNIDNSNVDGCLPRAKESDAKEHGNMLISGGDSGSGGDGRNNRNMTISHSTNSTTNNNSNNKSSNSHTNSNKNNRNINNSGNSENGTAAVTMEESLMEFIHVPAFAHYDVRSMSCVLSPDHLRTVLTNLRASRSGVTGATAASLAYNHNSSIAETVSDNNNTADTVNDSLNSTKNANARTGEKPTLHPSPYKLPDNRSDAFINDNSLCSPGSDNNNGSYAAELSTQSSNNNASADGTSSTVADNIVAEDTIEKGDGRENALIQS